MHKPCPDCGRIYNDEDHSTLCPHEFFQMNTLAVRADGTTKRCHTLKELKEFMDA